MSENLSLFVDSGSEVSPQPAEQERKRPLADRVRPQTWEAMCGLEKLDAHLVARLKSGQGVPPSLILWGPPGCGKTTLAKLIGRTFRCRFEELSAVLSGVKEIRAVVELAQKSNQATILFVDEIHRFSKSQQDAFLPHVEAGTICLIGATTENPSFYLTSALLSRMRLVALSGVSEAGLLDIAARGAELSAVSLDAECVRWLAQFVGGDARRLLNVVESIGEAFPGKSVNLEQVKSFLADSRTGFYDRDGEEHYNVASAFIKSLRGSDPDAALFWGIWMLEHGEDPRFLCRRMMIFASEDIGNADPRALQLAVATAEAFERIGLPEGRIPIAQCITYLASAPKSNRSYKALREVESVVRTQAKVSVPLHLRNAPTKLMKEIGYGENYEYPHDKTEGFVRGVQYLPDELKGSRFYKPSSHGLEKAISEKLAQVRGEKS